MLLMPGTHSLSVPASRVPLWILPLGITFLIASQKAQLVPKALGNQCISHSIDYVPVPLMLPCNNRLVSLCISSMISKPLHARS